MNKTLKVFDKTTTAVGVVCGTVFLAVPTVVIVGFIITIVRAATVGL